MIKFFKKNFFLKDKSKNDPVVDYVVKLCNAYNKKNFLNTSLYDAEFAVIDTETTGLDVKTAKIINLAAVKIKGFKIIDYFNAFINPNIEIDPNSVKWHGITDYMVKGKPTITEVLPEFLRFIKDSIIVGHHIKFDMEMISKELLETYGCTIKQRCIDTMFIYTRGVIKRDDHVTLDFLLDLYRVKCIGRHTALGDAMATAEVFIKMIMQLYDEYKRVSELFDLQKDNTVNM